MFKISSALLCIALLFILPVSSCAGSDNPFAVHFPIKEGVVYYAVRGNQKGAKLLYFKDYGEKQLLIERQNTTFMKQKAHSNTIKLILPDAEYLLDTKRKIAHKIPKQSFELFRIYQKLSKKKQQKILSALQKGFGKSLDNLDGNCIANARKIAGITCNEEEKEGIHLCRNNGLTLASEVSILGFNVKTFATKIEAKKVDPALFEIPSDFKIVSEPKKDTHTQKIIRRLLSSQPVTPCRSAKTAPRKRELHEALYEEIHRLCAHF